VGNVFSGVSGPRGGRPAVGSLPVLRFSARARLRAGAPYLRVEDRSTGTVFHGPLSWPIALDSTALHFGGRRRWLMCPRCSSRRTALYVNGADLACRVCLGLRYDSQHETERDRLFRKAHKLRDRLGWGGGVADRDGEKPAGMHRTTFQRLRVDLASLSADILGELKNWLGRAEKTVGVTPQRECSSL
jgi:hypothetical protein